MTNIDENEVGKHLKKKNSNTSKSKEKAKHKHSYEECLLRYKYQFLGETRYGIEIASYCTICGKVGPRIKDGKMSQSLIDKNAIFIQSEDKEHIFEEFKDEIPVFEVDDIFQKFVPVRK